MPVNNNKVMLIKWMRRFQQMTKIKKYKNQYCFSFFFFFFTFFITKKIIHLVNNGMKNKLWMKKEKSKTISKYLNRKKYIKIVFIDWRREKMEKICFRVLTSFAVAPVNAAVICDKHLLRRSRFFLSVACFPV